MSEPEDYVYVRRQFEREDYEDEDRIHPLHPLHPLHDAIIAFFESGQIDAEPQKSSSNSTATESAPPAQR